MTTHLVYVSFAMPRDSKIWVDLADRSGHGVGFNHTTLAGGCLWSLLEWHIYQVADLHENWMTHLGWVF